MDGQRPPCPGAHRQASSAGSRRPVHSRTQEEVAATHSRRRICKSHGLEGPPAGLPFLNVTRYHRESVGPVHEQVRVSQHHHRVHAFR